LCSCQDGNAADVCDWLHAQWQWQGAPWLDRQADSLSQYDIPQSTKIPECEEFDSDINEGENTHHITDDIATCNKNHSASCASSEASTSAVS